jgi:butyryl-CoA dehydrogenase
VLNGSKIFITHGGVGQVFVITAVTDPSKGTDGISSFILTKDAVDLDPVAAPDIGHDPSLPSLKGFRAGKKEDKLGWRASDTRELSFRSCAVPEGNLLGERGRGFKQFLDILDGGRISVAAMGVGLAQGAYDLAIAYAKERHQFGQPIASFQAIQFQLADMATEVEAGRQLVYRAAWLKDEGKPFALAAAQAKLYTGLLSNRAVNAALQIHGGYGFMDEFAISRLYRDQKILEIGEGTNEVQRMVIARHLGL